MDIRQSAGRRRIGARMDAERLSPAVGPGTDRLLVLMQGGFILLAAIWKSAAAPGVRLGLLPTRTRASDNAEDARPFGAEKSNRSRAPRAYILAKWPHRPRHVTPSRAGPGLSETVQDAGEDRSGPMVTAWHVPPTSTGRYRPSVLSHRARMSGGMSMRRQSSTKKPLAQANRPSQSPSECTLVACAQPRGDVLLHSVQRDEEAVVITASSMLGILVHRLYDVEAIARRSRWDAVIEQLMSVACRMTIKTNYPNVNK